MPLVAWSCIWRETTSREDFASAASARLASRCFNAWIWMPFAASRPMRVMAIAPRAVAPASATVCALMFFFSFLSLHTPLSFFRVSHNWKKVKNCTPCPPKNDPRGTTFDLNFSSAIRWIQARLALPLAQTTTRSGGEGSHFVSIHVKQFSPREKDTHRT